ncbi:MAG: hypothetical protein KAJ19_09295 [Gammaproteobacteria bacterium]|nr:hypothetical protein [Gammaproteobacteria bacterium]
MKTTIISAAERARLIHEEEVAKDFELRIPLIEDYAVPSDFSYLRDDGDYNIELCAIEHSLRRGYIIYTLEQEQAWVGGDL